MNRLPLALLLFAAPAEPQITLQVDGDDICPTSEIRYETGNSRLVVVCRSDIFRDSFE